MKKIIIGFFILGFFIVPSNIKQKSFLIDKNKNNFTAQTDIQCMSDVIFYEANSESYEGKLAVGTVVMNRVKHKAFPKTVCDVVKQRSKRGCQFSWVCGQRAKMNKDLYLKANKVAFDILVHQKRLTSIKNALYFHAEGISPSWTSNLIPIKQIGPHIFYVKKI